ncbi:MAG: transposase [Rhodobacteraceae bacterium]|nr:transposase [Paracoccaceae bacterium]
MRQTESIRPAWPDSGKVYGYRKRADDLRDQGEQVSKNRVARLACLERCARCAPFSQQNHRPGSLQVTRERRQNG